MESGILLNSINPQAHWHGTTSTTSFYAPDHYPPFAREIELTRTTSV